VVDPPGGQVDRQHPARFRAVPAAVRDDGDDDGRSEIVPVAIRARLVVAVTEIALPPTELVAQKSLARVERAALDGGHAVTVVTVVFVAVGAIVHVHFSLSALV
jgi:hypothetical protein